MVVKKENQVPPYGKLIGFSLAMIHAKHLISDINYELFVKTQNIDTDFIKERDHLLRKLTLCLTEANHLAQQISSQISYPETGRVVRIDSKILGQKPSDPDQDEC
jgi:hypothetical protein